MGQSRVHRTQSGNEIRICVINQRTYIKRLHKQSISDFFSLRLLRAQLAWTANSRPDICCAVATSDQVNDEVFNCDRTARIKQTNLGLYHLEKYADLFILYPKLKKELLDLRDILDASLATNYDKNSKLKYFIFIADKNEKFHPIHWKLYKSKG